MPSPFPGMDPYLEHPAHWSGFHTRFIVASSAAISRVLPRGYYADVEQHVWLEGDDPDGCEPFAKPDGYVAKTEGGGSAAAMPPATIPSTEVTLPNPEKKGHKLVKIVDQPGNRVVTVIEVLSPSNKEPGKDRDAYLYKRNEYLHTGTNLVEIDLWFDGERVPIGKPRPPRADSYALVCRANRFPKASVWAFTVRDVLPNLPVPLKPSDGEIVLALRPCLDRAYEDAGYQNRIDYAHRPAVALSTAYANWAAELLKVATN
ncbi:MAG: DUF4058 family protein [Planctomycetes bacterium]|nr:DUF4058 family protein [Planctomycetota bacterium]